MSRLDRDRLRRYPLDKRQSKVNVSCFGRPHEVGDSVSRFLEKLPDCLGARDLIGVARAIVQARANGKTVLVGMGAHPIKVGLSPLIIDLLKAGWITGLATNGAGLVHDFELALAGHTSEEVDEALGNGSFGMAAETGDLLNGMIAEGASQSQGLGEAVGSRLLCKQTSFAEQSLLIASIRKRRPMTVHVAIGTDVHHLHPSAGGAALGEASYRDFLTFCERVSTLEQGVYINVGSAVLLPEVFLKALSLARNLGYSLHGMTTVNMDFIQHYRPLNNVVRRPATLGGRGYALTGHHEILLPLLSAAVKEEAVREGVQQPERTTP